MWCPLPWTHLSVKNNGTLRLCSHSQSAGQGETVLHHEKKILTLGSLNNTDILNCDTLKQVRVDMLQGNWPLQCKRCETETISGRNSRNMWETKRHEGLYTHATAIKDTKADGTILNPKILTFDLRVGNQCNLRCVMCFPGESTKWYKDYKEITGSSTFTVDDKIYNLSLTESDFNWVRDSEIIRLLVKNSKFLLKINFGGGEPIAIKHHLELIEALVDAGYSKNIELEYSSNVTIFPENLFNLWKKFKLIKICASIDAYGPANEAVRYYSKWKTIEDNLVMLDNTPDNIIVFTSTTISMLTLEHYGSLMTWIKNQNYKKINKNINSPAASHLVSYPACLNISILDDKYQKLIFDYLYQQSNDNKFLKTIESYNKYCSMRKNNDINNRIEFSKRFFKLEINQSQNWSDIFPIASQIAVEWRDLYGN